ncbi:MAG: DNA polymerase subunit beta [Stackebrandtia sp.]
MRPHPTVEAVADAYLSLADEAAPGVIEGLYLSGSTALDDYRPGSSDVDFAAVVAAPPDDSLAETLRAVHERLIGRFPAPHFDGTYVTWEELASHPDDVPPGPSTHMGVFARADDFSRDLVTWHTLAQCGVAIRGPRAPRIAVDPEGLKRWVRGNLDTYWRGWLRDGGDPVSPRGQGMLSDYGTMWCVAGVGRMRYTLDTGGVTSKRGGCEHARAVLDSRWRRILDEALRIRADAGGSSLYDDPAARRDDVLAYMEVILADARAGGAGG